MGKLKIKQKKKAFIPYTNQQANAFAQSIQNCQKELKEMEKKAYEDGFTVGEDWSNTINTVTTMTDPQRLIRAAEIFEATGKSIVYWQ